MDFSTWTNIAFAGVAVFGTVLFALSLLALRRSPSPRMGLVAGGFQRLSQAVDVFLLLDFAWEECLSAKLTAEFLDRGFGALILVSEQQGRAFTDECLCDRISDAPLIPDAENHGGSAFEKVGHGSSF